MQGHSRESRRSSWWALLSLVAFVGCQTLSPSARRPVFFPLPPAEPRVQFLTAINLAWDVVPERTGFAGLVFGERPELKRKEKVMRPHGIAVWQGKIYVCDKGGGNVKIFDVINGRFRLLGGGLGYLQGPTAIAVAADGYKFVVESFRKRIHVFDPHDGYLTSFQLEEGRPAGLVVMGSELFVADVEFSRIQVIDRVTGEVTRIIGSKGTRQGQFQMPNAIAADEEGKLYLSDQFNNRFQKLDAKGRPLLVVGKMGDVYGTFGRPRGIAVGPDGIIYVGDAMFNHVQMFDQEGRVLMVFGSSHPASGLKAPAAIAVDQSTLPYFSKFVDPRFEAEYLIFVTSMLGEQLIGVYAFGQLKPGVPVPALYSDEGPGGAPSP